MTFLIVSLISPSPARFLCCLQCNLYPFNVEMKGGFFIYIYYPPFPIFLSVGKELLDLQSILHTLMASHHIFLSKSISIHKMDIMIIINTATQELHNILNHVVMKRQKQMDSEEKCRLQVGKYGISCMNLIYSSHILMQLTPSGK